MALVYLISESRYVNPEKQDWYIDQILLEDQLISDALAEHGIKTQRVDWADDQIDWTKGNLAVFRTPWDYFERIDEFRSWMDRTKELIKFINPYEQILWNFNKRYLQDLESKGFPIVPSVFIDKEDKRSLASICKDLEWEEFIIKPCISGGGFGTYRVAPEEIGYHEGVYRELINDRDMMIQEFHPSIQSRGEASHMVMGGIYTHSILKRAKGEDFRVQDDFGGTVHPYQAVKEEIALAEAVFKACEPLPAYGRLDVMWNGQGDQMISELEIIEPELWFRNHPPAAKTFADHLRSYL